jgi:hypothetical protein
LKDLNLPPATMQKNVDLELEAIQEANNMKKYYEQFKVSI